MNRKFVSIPAGKSNVIVEIADADEQKVISGSRAVFGSDPAVAFKLGQPKECIFQPGDEPDRKEAKTDPAFPGLFFWMRHS